MVMFRLYLEGIGESALMWVPLAGGLAAITIVGRQPDGDPPAEHQAHARVLRRGPHRLHARGLRRGVGRRHRDDAVLSGRVPVREHGRVPRRRGGGPGRGLREHRRPIAGSPSGRRSSPSAMLLFLLSLGGIPFVAGFWAKLYVFWAAAEQGLYWLVLLGAVLTVVALFYYLLVAKRMYIDAPEPRSAAGARSCLLHRHLRRPGSWSGACIRSPWSWRRSGPPGHYSNCLKLCRPRCLPVTAGPLPGSRSDLVGESREGPRSSGRGDRHRGEWASIPARARGGSRLGRPSMSAGGGEDRFRPLLTSGTALEHRI